MKETVSMFTRDGVRLDADVYRPDAEGSFPVLLMRQPYGRSIASTVVYAHPTWYAQQGYIVVIQDVRGRGTSEGEFKLFAHEIADGFDTVNWASQLPGSNGKVGMYGFSYQGMTQLYAAVEKPPALKTICPAMIGYDLYHDWAYEGGAFCLQANLSWAIQIAAETARLKNDEQAFQILYAASRNLPLFDTIPAYPEIIQKYAPDSFYHEWIEHDRPNEYWEKLSPKTYLKNIDLPILHVGGWFDTFLRGTVNLYKEMASRSHFLQYLLIGPWAHLPWGRKVGSIDYGLAAANPIDELQIRWFDRFLKGIDTGITNEPSISLFEMGSNHWKCFQHWPNNSKTSYFLQSNGLASMREDAGKLTPPPTPTRNGEGGTIAEISSVSDTFIHDPWRPVPALGGHAAFPAGAFERSAIDCRTDVLTYTTAPLTEDLLIVGDVFVEIYCRADKPSFDLSAVLSEVRSNGNVYNFTQGYVRVQPNQSTQPVKIELQPTCIKITAGNQLRLSLSAACFPAYPVNSGTGSKNKETRLIEAEIMTISVQSGGNFPSRICW
ncbi:S15 family X-Pro dipeptidyl-peptidase [[Phormidium ambiguum] IAM M-71]|uniref:S15 family X-Pro dipeptidyl-peptidase n=1 Tax=[Phormidium ambiguum] IAM M-71 TaxID=454136 RepID=A0A1U7IJA1_9CYAN|nr:CocE/NonD family hydrolase [Phormidium ambiguum]OKH37178.1 S15 family X-Pro dipeptidyl-peptidase [Phormidium ambiguum IAM M-71]